MASAQSSGIERCFGPTHAISDGDIAIAIAGDRVAFAPDPARARRFDAASGLRLAI